MVDFQLDGGKAVALAAFIALAAVIIAFTTMGLAALIGIAVVAIAIVLLWALGVRVTDRLTGRRSRGRGGGGGGNY